MSARLVIVRHGNTFAPGEAPRRIGARTDIPLVPSGQEQATRLGDWFASEGWRFDRILTSPLRRTRETAQAICAAFPDAPDADLSNLLAEIDHGPDEDRTEEEVQARIGAEALARWDDAGTPPPGWIVDLPARLDGWRDLFRRAEGTAVLVTSNGAARFALLADAGLRAQADRLPSLKLRTGAFGIVTIDGTTLELSAWDRRP